MAPLPIAVRATPKIARSAFQKRAISDVAITRTGKPIIRVQGGRYVLHQLAFVIARAIVKFMLTYLLLIGLLSAATLPRYLARQELLVDTSSTD